MALTRTHKKRAGSFDKRMDFENWVESAGDGMGGSEGSWIKEKTMYVNLKPVSGRERIHNEAIESDVTHKVQIRHNDFDITAKSRLTYGNRTFNLKYVLNQGEDDAYWELAAVEQ